MSTIVSEKDLVTKSDCDNHVKTMTNELKDVKDAVNDLRVDIAKMPELILEKGDKRYADKRIEKNFDKVVWLVLAGVVVGLLNLVLR